MGSRVWIWDGILLWSGCDHAAVAAAPVCCAGSVYVCMLYILRMRSRVAVMLCGCDHAEL